MGEEDLKAKLEKEMLIDLLFPSRKKDVESLENVTKIKDSDQMSVEVEANPMPEARKDKRKQKLDTDTIRDELPDKNRFEVIKKSTKIRKDKKSLENVSKTIHSDQIPLGIDKAQEARPKEIETNHVLETKKNRRKKKLGTDLIRDELPADAINHSFQAIKIFNESKAQSQISSPINEKTTCFEKQFDDVKKSRVMDVVSDEFLQDQINEDLSVPTKGNYFSSNNLKLAIILSNNGTLSL